MGDIENYPSTESNVQDREVFGELIQKCLDQTDLFKRMFFEGDELDIWLDSVSSTPIRALAIKWHRSRYTVRKTIKRVDKKLSIIRRLFSV